MKTNKKSFNEIPQTKTKAKLLKVNTQLNNLDKEINSIQNELNKSKSLSSDNILDDVSIFPEKRKKYRLYKKSIQVMNKRAENAINEEDPVDLIPQNKPKIHIKGYKPPSERIFDVNERKMKLVKRIQEENERRIADDCTFKPKINQISKEIEYDPNHLIQPKRKQDSPAEQTDQKKRKNNDEMNGIGIYERQIQKNIYHQPEVEKGNVISPRSEKNMIERLTKPKEDPNDHLNAPKELKNYATKQGTMRLVAKSIKRYEPEVQIEAKPKSLMNRKSKEITKNTKVDLYEEYLEAKERVKQKNDEVIEWRKLTEKKESRNNEQVRYKKIRTDQNPNVAGMDDYIDRMKKRPVKKEEVIRRVNPGIIVAKPFNFEIRDEIRKNSKPIEDDDFLAEISDILRQVQY